MSGGRYTFEREIGRGASGPVWTGQDTVLGRRVALKRVGTHPGATAADAAVGAREARLAASLNHPHVVGVLDLAVIDDEHWLVMECVDGTNLAQLVRDQGALEPGEAARLLAQVAEALDAAHRAGIVHRDVKPSNVLVGSGGDAKLTDFGIARSADDATLTATGLVTGSPAYLAPEVATGASATPASDVWSLGATLYHLLAGRPPYHVGDNVLSTMYRIVHEEPPRLPELGRLNLVLEHTMSTDPEQRWSMWQVHEALAHVAAEEPEARRPVMVGGAPSVADTGATTTRSSRTGVRPRAYAPAPASSRRRRAPWLVGAAVVLLASVLAFQLGRGDGDERQVPAAAPTAGAETSPVTEATSEESTERQMVRFVEEYLADVTDDPRTSWPRLTPEFQEQSGGFGSYNGFWRTVRSATPRSVDADAATMTVTYDVDYVMRNGSRTSDRVTLQLSGSGSSLKIAGES